MAARRPVGIVSAGGGEAWSGPAADPRGVVRTLGLFSAMAHLATLYKGAGVPLFFYNGVG